MTIYQLQVFSVVAKLRNFTQAGKKLRIRQPSVSLLIQSLQQELGVKLFERLGTKLLLTRAGQELLRLTEDILPKVEGIKERLDEIGGLKKGKISVGGPAIAGASFLPGAVQAFIKDYPGIDMTLKIERSQTLEKELLEGTLDVALLGRTPGSPLLVSEPYCDEEIVAIAPPNHRLIKRRSVPLELIVKEPFITHKKGAIIRDMVEQRFIEKGLPFTPIFEVDLPGVGRDAIKRAVVSGHGIGFLSKCHVVADIEARRLKILKVPELRLKRTIYIAVHKNRQNAPLAQAFRDFLRNYKK